MTPLETLKGMLNDPDGNCSVHGTDEDRRIIGEALRGVEATIREQADEIARLDRELIEWQNGSVKWAQSRARAALQPPATKEKAL